ncbi:MAG: glycosyl hydrolase family 39 [Acidobacteriota bacterium]|nr:glycosyl hydrolase family 39 [Acidobacteriota bacterium]
MLTLTSVFRRISSLAAFLALFSLATFAQPAAAPDEVIVRAADPATPFPHFWEQMFGSGRAILSLRQSYRDDLRAVKQVTDFRYVRFHAILLDELGVYNEDEHGAPIYNFTYVDQVYDGLLANGVRPVVEIGFMPQKLSADSKAIHPFWYKQNVAPPKSWERWDELIRRMAQNLVDRYGVDEASQWYFEVWNEPNIDFWAGDPKQPTYFELYDHTARALKSVSGRLRVGGPATAAASWIPDFLAHAAREHVPVDFVSTHGYADDTVENLLGTHEEIPYEQRLCRAVRKVRGVIDASPSPHLPLFWTETNVRGDHALRDTPYVGPALAESLRDCDGQVDAISNWTFSDVFEENGPALEPFIGQFGLRAMGGINKPSYYDYALLHQLGRQRLPARKPSGAAAPGVLATRLPDGRLALAVWNLVPPEQQPHQRHVRLRLEGVPDNARVSVQRVDSRHGNVLPFYEKMGSPKMPTPAQAAELNRASALGRPQRLRLHHGELPLELEPNALVLIEVER